jgi:hypothetical protein
VIVTFPLPLANRIQTYMKLPAALLLTMLVANAQTKTPVLVELFTSEGCSSCPPADKLAEALDTQQPFANADLIVLGEHVDYWDGAWKDRFSSPAHTKRQWAYAKYFRTTGVYTPQMVVDGRSEFVGSNGPDAKAAIQKALANHKHPIVLTAKATGNKLKASIRIAGLASKGATVFVAVGENQAESKVTRGENTGLLLKHAAVVRSLEAVGEMTNDFARDLEINLPSSPAGLRIVTFVQDRASGHILAIAQEKL